MARARTQLDVIAEEVFGKGALDGMGSVDLFLLDCALERAFRHGVERALTPFWKDKIQPAPAEEFRNPWLVFATDGKGRDRRKGERRKGTGKPALVEEDLGCTVFDAYRVEPGVWKSDRRSGKDRRKDRRKSFLRCVKYRCFKPLNHAGPHEEVHSW